MLERLVAWCIIGIIVLGFILLVVVAGVAGALLFMFVTGRI